MAATCLFCRDVRCTAAPSVGGDHLLDVLPRIRLVMQRSMSTTPGEFADTRPFLIDDCALKSTWKVR
jgi:hypothetical protein